MSPPVAHEFMSSSLLIYPSTDLLIYYSFPFSLSFCLLYSVFYLLKYYSLFTNYYTLKPAIRWRNLVIFPDFFWLFRISLQPRARSKGESRNLIKQGHCELCALGTCPIGGLKGCSNLPIIINACINRRSWPQPSWRLCQPPRRLPRNDIFQLFFIVNHH